MALVPAPAQHGCPRSPLKHLEGDRELSRAQTLVLLKGLRTLFRRIITTTSAGIAAGSKAHDCAVFENSAICWAYILGTAKDADAGAVSITEVPAVQGIVFVRVGGDEAVTAAELPFLRFRPSPLPLIEDDFTVISLRVLKAGEKAPVAVAPAAGARAGAAGADVGEVHPLLQDAPEPHDASSWQRVSVFLALAAFSRLRNTPVGRLKDLSTPSPSSFLNYLHLGGPRFFDRSLVNLSGGTAAKVRIYCPLWLEPRDIDVDDLIAAAADSATVENAGGASVGFTRVPTKMCVVVLDKSGSMAERAFDDVILPSASIGASGAAGPAPTAAAAAAGAAGAAAVAAAKAQLTRMDAVRLMFHGACAGLRVCVLSRPLALLLPPPLTALANRSAANDLPHVMGLVTVDAHVQVACELTESYSVFVRATSSIAASGQTAIYNGMNKALKMLQQCVVKRPAHAASKLRILVLTDGVDNASEVNIQALAGNLMEAKVTVDVVLVGAAQGTGVGVDPTLAAVSELTGGGVFYPKTWEAALSLFEAEPFLALAARDRSVVPEAPHLSLVPAVRSGAVDLWTRARTVPFSVLHTGQFKQPRSAVLATNRALDLPNSRPHLRAGGGGKGGGHCCVCCGSGRRTPQAVCCFLCSLPGGARRLLCPSSGGREPQPCVRPSRQGAEAHPRQPYRGFRRLHGRGCFDDVACRDESAGCAQPLPWRGVRARRNLPSRVPEPRA
jgi:hypothetical protein